MENYITDPIVFYVLFFDLLDSTTVIDALQFILHNRKIIIFRPPFPANADAYLHL